MCSSRCVMPILSPCNNTTINHLGPILFFGINKLHSSIIYLTYRDFANKTATQLELNDAS